MDEEKKKVGGRKATEWNILVGKKYKEGKKKNKNYKLGEAMQAAKKIYRKSTSKMTNISMAKSNRRSSQTRKGRSSTSRRSVMTI
jgi:hypothetical protein